MMAHGISRRSNPRFNRSPRISTTFGFGFYWYGPFFPLPSLVGRGSCGRFHGSGHSRASSFPPRGRNKQRSACMCESCTCMEYQV